MKDFDSDEHAMVGLSLKKKSFRVELQYLLHRDCKSS